MSTATPSDALIKSLNHVIQLDVDAIGAYRTAIERLENTEYKAKLLEFMADHERHVADLSAAVRTEGGTPPGRRDFKHVLTRGHTVIVNLGGDSTILKAMKMNEEQTNKEYEYASLKDFPEHVRTLLQNGLTDERRHRAWIRATLEELQ
jgi:rubrerythrin